MAKKTLKNVAYEYLLKAIMSYELKPGQVIVEQEISDLLKISRTPVREAFKQLEAEGLVCHFPSQSTFVANLTVQDIEEIFQLREMFEVNALKSAISCIAEEELQYIRGHLRYLEGKKSENAFIREEFYESDRELHKLIMKYCGNLRMVKFHNTLGVQLEQLRRISSMTPMRLYVSRQEHIDIINALSNRDLEAATEALRLHFHNIKMSALAVCRSRSVMY